MNPRQEILCADKYFIKNNYSYKSMKYNYILSKDLLSVDSGFLTLAFPQMTTRGTVPKCSKSPLTPMLLSPTLLQKYIYRLLSFFCLFLN